METMFDALAGFYFAQREGSDGEEAGGSGSRRGRSAFGHEGVRGRDGAAFSKCYTLAHSGEVPSFKLGKYWKFRRSEIRAWVEKHRVGARV